jgi:hypothetical protein
MCLREKTHRIDEPPHLSGLSSDFLLYEVKVDESTTQYIQKRRRSFSYL